MSKYGCLHKKGYLRAVSTLIVCIFAFTNISYSVHGDALVPKPRTASAQFREIWKPAAICRFLEQEGDITRLSTVEDIYTISTERFIEPDVKPFTGIKIARVEVNQHNFEVLIKIPGDDRYIRYYDPGRSAAVPNPLYPDKLGVKTISVSLHRQILPLSAQNETEEEEEPKIVALPSPIDRAISLANVAKQAIIRHDLYLAEQLLQEAKEILDDNTATVSGEQRITEIVIAFNKLTFEFIKTGNLTKASTYNEYAYEFMLNADLNKLETVKKQVRFVVEACNRLANAYIRRKNRVNSELISDRAFDLFERFRPYSQVSYIISSYSRIARLWITHENYKRAEITLRPAYQLVKDAELAKIPLVRLQVSYLLENYNRIANAYIRQRLLVDAEEMLDNICALYAARKDFQEPRKNREPVKEQFTYILRVYDNLIAAYTRQHDYDTAERIRREYGNILRPPSRRQVAHKRAGKQRPQGPDLYRLHAELDRCASIAEVEAFERRIAEIISNLRASKNPEAKKFLLDIAMKKISMEDRTAVRSAPATAAQKTTPRTKPVKRQPHKKQKKPKQTIDTRIQELRIALEKKNTRKIQRLLGILEPKMNTAARKGNPFKDEYVELIQRARRMSAGGFIIKGDTALARMATNLKNKNYTDITDDDTIKSDIENIERRTLFNIRTIAGGGNELRIIETDAVVADFDDFVFGFYSHAPEVKGRLTELLGGDDEFNMVFKTPTLVLTRELLSKKQHYLVRQEYIYHEAVCHIYEHQQSIIKQQNFFPGNYEKGEYELDGRAVKYRKDKTYKLFKGALGTALQKIILEKMMDKVSHMNASAEDLLQHNDLKTAEDLLPGVTQILQRAHEYYGREKCRDNELVRAQLLYLIGAYNRLANAYTKNKETGKAEACLLRSSDLITEYNYSRKVRETVVPIITSYCVLAAVSRNSNDNVNAERFLDAATRLFDNYQHVFGVKEKAVLIVEGYTKLANRQPPLQARSSLKKAQGLIEEHRSIESIRAQAKYVIAGYTILADALIKSQEHSQLMQAEAFIDNARYLFEKYCDIAAVEGEIGHIIGRYTAIATEHGRQGNLKKAEKCVNKAFDLFCKNKKREGVLSEVSYIITGYTYLTRVYVEQKKFKKAEKCLTKACELFAKYRTCQNVINQAHYLSAVYGALIKAYHEQNDYSAIQKLRQYFAPILEPQENAPSGAIVKGTEALKEMAENIRDGKFKDYTKNEDLQRALHSIKEVLTARGTPFVEHVPLRIFVTDAVVKNPKDFAFGFYSHAKSKKTKLKQTLGGKAKFKDVFSRPTLVLTKELLFSPNRRVALEYLYHEIRCTQVSHEQAIIEQQGQFPDNYNFEGFEEDEKTGIKYRLDKPGSLFKGMMGGIIRGLVYLIYTSNLHADRNKLLEDGSLAQAEKLLDESETAIDELLVLVGTASPENLTPVKTQMHAVISDYIRIAASYIAKEKFTEAENSLGNAERLLRKYGPFVDDTASLEEEIETVRMKITMTQEGGELAELDSLVGKYIEGEDFVKAEEVLNDVRRILKEHPEAGHTASSIAKVISGYAALGRAYRKNDDPELENTGRLLDVAWGLFAEHIHETSVMEQLQNLFVGYIRLVNAYTKEEKLKKSEALLARIFERLEEYQHTDAAKGEIPFALREFSFLIHAYMNKKKLQKAEDLLKTISGLADKYKNLDDVRKSVFFIASHYTRLVLHLIAQDDLEKAEERLDATMEFLARLGGENTLESMAPFLIRVHNDLADAYTEQEDIEKAAHYLDETCRLFQGYCHLNTIHGQAYYIIMTYNNFVNACVQLDEHGTAEGLQNKWRIFLKKYNDRIITVNRAQMRHTRDSTADAHTGNHPGHITQGENAFAVMTRNLEAGNFTDITEDDDLKKDIRDVERRIGARLHEEAGLNTPFRVIVTDAVIDTYDDFSFGFYSHAPATIQKFKKLFPGREDVFNRLFPEPTLVLSREMLADPDPLIRQEYIFHEALCHLYTEHSEMIARQQNVFPENYKEGIYAINPADGLKYVDDSYKKLFKGRFGRTIRALIDWTAGYNEVSGQLKSKAKEQVTDIVGDLPGYSHTAHDVSSNFAHIVSAGGAVVVFSDLFGVRGDNAIPPIETYRSCVNREDPIPFWIIARDQDEVEKIRLMGFQEAHFEIITDKDVSDHNKDGFTDILPEYDIIRTKIAADRICSNTDLDRSKIMLITNPLNIDRSDKTGVRDAFASAITAKKGCVVIIPESPADKNSVIFSDMLITYALYLMFHGTDPDSFVLFLPAIQKLTGQINSAIDKLHNTKHILWAA